MYFTATCPYVLMIILLVRGALLEGSMEGIKFYVVPCWDKLWDMQVE
jgi:solute carrier family 6 amino acid transporter-like protein 5/7/9/14